jgi:hypothetical protein
MRKAYVHDVFIAHRVKENNLGYFTQSTKTALVLLHAKKRKAVDRGEIIAHREKEKILGYFTLRRKERTSSTLRKEAQSR